MSDRSNKCATIVLHTSGRTPCLSTQQSYSYIEIIETEQCGGWFSSREAKWLRPAGATTTIEPLLFSLFLPLREPRLSVPPLLIFRSSLVRLPVAAGSRILSKNDLHIMTATIFVDIGRRRSTYERDPGLEAQGKRSPGCSL